MMEWISQSILAIGIMFFISGISQVKCKTKEIHTINAEIDKVNRLKEERCEELEQQIKDKLNDIEEIENRQENTLRQYTIDIHERRNTLEQVDHDVKNKRQQLEDLQKDVTATLNNQKKLSQVAFENYCETLVKSYDEKEKEYQDSLSLLQNSYSEEQLKIIKELEDAREENKKQLEQEKEIIAQELAEERKILDKVRETRAAAVQAQLKEKEIEANKDNYRLNISEASIKDIRLLKSIQKDITNSIVIDKIIQSNYYQPLAKIKFPKIISKPTVCGIYKITDIITKAVYIGQSVDCCERQKQHCKNALGVGNITGDNNKLYNAMREDNLYNFTFEILEECNSSLLDEKEKYYIELYDSYNFGLNGNKGNG